MFTTAKITKKRKVHNADARKQLKIYFKKNVVDVHGFQNNCSPVKLEFFKFKDIFWGFLWKMTFFYISDFLIKCKWNLFEWVVLGTIILPVVGCSFSDLFGEIEPNLDQLDELMTSLTKSSNSRTKWISAILKQL